MYINSFNSINKNLIKVPKVFEPTYKTIKSKISIYTWSKRMPKYWSNGDVCPGWVGTLKQMQINQMIPNLMIEL